MNSTMTGEYKYKSSLSVSAWYNHQLTEGTESTHNQLFSTSSESLIPQVSAFIIWSTLLYPTVYIAKITLLNNA